MSSEFATIDLTQRRQEVRSGQEKSVEGLHIRPCQSGSVGRFIKDWQAQTRKQALQQVQYVGPLSQSSDKSIQTSDNLETGGADFTGGASVIDFDPSARHRFPNRTIARHSQPMDSDRTRQVADWQKSNPQKLWYPLYFRQSNYEATPATSTNVQTKDSTNRFSQHNMQLTTEHHDSCSVSDASSDKPMSVDDSIDRFIEKCKFEITQDDRLKRMPSYVLLAADIFVQELWKTIDRAHARDYVAYESAKSNNDLHRVLINILVRISQGVFARQNIREGLNKRLDYVNKEDKRVLNPKKIPWEQLNYQNEVQSDSDLTERIVNDSIAACVSDLTRRIAKRQTEDYKLENHHINVKPIGGTFIYDRYRYNEKKPRSYRVCRKLWSEETGHNGPHEQDPRALWDVDPDELDKSTGLLPEARNQVLGGQCVPVPDFDHLLPKRDRDRLHSHLYHR